MVGAAIIRVIDDFWRLIAREMTGNESPWFRNEGGRRAVVQAFPEIRTEGLPVATAEGAVAEGTVGLARVEPLGVCRIWDLGSCRGIGADGRWQGMPQGKGAAPELWDDYRTVTCKNG